MVTIFYENKILTDKSKAILLNQFEKNNQTTFQEIIRDERRVPIWAGGAPGVNGIIIQFLTKNITITVLSNFSPPMAINMGMAIRSIIEEGILNHQKFL